MQVCQVQQLLPPRFGTMQALHASSSKNMASAVGALVPVYMARPVPEATDTQTARTLPAAARQMYIKYLAPTVHVTTDRLFDTYSMHAGHEQKLGW